MKVAEPVISVCSFPSVSILASILTFTQPETAASVPAHQDTSEDDEPEQFAPVPVRANVTTAARIKSPPVAARPQYTVLGAQVVKQQEDSSDDDDDDDDEDDEDDADKALVPPPKKRARKSEHPPPPPPPVVTKEKEKEKGKREKERKERKEKKYRE